MSPRRKFEEEDPFAEPDFEDEEWDSEEEDELDEYAQETEITIPGSPDQHIIVLVHRYQEDEFPWLDNIEAKCTCEDEEIGYTTCRYIRRDAIKARFWENMVEPSQGMSELAFDIFDRYGNVKQGFKDHPVRSGFKVWKNELDHGRLFFIEEMFVADEWRRKGLGRAMLTALFQKAQDRLESEKASFKKRHPLDFMEMKQSDMLRRPHALVVPGWLRNDVEAKWMGKSPRQRQAIKDQAIDAAVRFYRSQGFRRVGASPCLAFSFNPKHRSHEILVDGDFDLPQPVQGDEDNDEDKGLEKARKDIPVHCALLTMPDLKCIELFETFPWNDQESWNQLDRTNSTPSHIAALMVKPESLRWLLENIPEAKSWNSARNLSGYTAFEELQAKLETGRTRRDGGMATIHVSDEFKGFPPAAVDCLAILSCPAEDQNQQDIIKLRLKYGCTCGECIDGFLSPRMKLALLYQAETILDILQFGNKEGRGWFTQFGHIFNRLPHDVLRDLRTDQALRQGFLNTLSQIIKCFKSNQIPNTETILRLVKDAGESPPETENYLNRAGGTVTIDAILKAIIPMAKSQDENAGDGDFKRETGRHLTVLKRCRNDHEFGFVAWAFNSKVEDL